MCHVQPQLVWRDDIARPGNGLMASVSHMSCGSTCNGALPCADTAVVGERPVATDVWDGLFQAEEAKRRFEATAQVARRTLPCDLWTGCRPLLLIGDMCIG